MPRAWACPGSSRATGPARASRRRWSSGPDACRSSAASPCRAAAPPPPPSRARVSVPVRWLLEPAQPFEAASAAPESRDRNYLFDALIAQVQRQPLRWHLILTIGQPGDPTGDATVAWPPDRERVDVGTLTLDRVEAEETSPARDINFDPLVLPAGIAPSDDPLLSARSAVYSRACTRHAVDSART